MTRRPNWAPALRHRNFRLFIGAQAVSLVGTHMQNLAQVWLVLVLTGNPFLAGLVAAVQGIPIATIALMGGVIADRFPKRAVLLATQGTMCLLALLLGVLALTQQVEVWQVVALAFALRRTTSVSPTSMPSWCRPAASDDHQAAAMARSTMSSSPARPHGRPRSDTWIRPSRRFEISFGSSGMQ